MTKRAEQALRGRFDPTANPAIGKLVEFAAQNPGLEFGNYGEWNAYNQERASITRDWKRFLKALDEAAHAGVTDKEVIAAAPGAFSGRLEWVTHEQHCQGCRYRKPVNGEQHAADILCSSCKQPIISTPPIDPRWDYCTGQYFPTEYRKAAATVLEYATRERLRSLPPTKKQTIRTIAELKELNESNGGCWFGKGEIKFFGTRIESGILHGRYFISSEQPPHGSRKFTVRTFDDEGGIDTIGEFCAYHDRAEAIAALKEHLQPVTA